MKNIQSSQVLISRVRIVSEKNISEPLDILFHGAEIAQISPPSTIIQNTYQINGEGKFLSLGWLDLRVTAGEPGAEYKETFRSLEKSALAGGFAAVALHSNTQHPIQSRETVSFIRHAGKNLRFYPVAAASQQLEGKEMTEYIDLFEAGTLAFSDGENALNNTSLLLRALRYLPHTGARLMTIASDADLSKGGLMHEGEMSTFLGMRGIPEIAEELAVQKALTVLKFTGGKLHFSLVSSRKTLELLENAKKEGLDITADTAFYHLDLNDQFTDGFDTNFKVFPPLRDEEDRLALIKAVKSGLIDVVVSNHSPQDIEGKRLEFDLAENGMTGLQTAFSIANLHLSPEEWVRAVAYQPRRITNLPIADFSVGSKLTFTLFDTETEWRYDEKNNFSKSKNSPYLGQVLKGKVFAVMTENGNLTVWEE
jgi:dihydroorotase